MKWELVHHTGEYSPFSALVKYHAENNRKNIWLIVKTVQYITVGMNSTNQIYHFWLYYYELQMVWFWFVFSWILWSKLELTDKVKYLGRKPGVKNFNEGLFYWRQKWIFWENTSTVGKILILSPEFGIDCSAKWNKFNVVIRP